MPGYHIDVMHSHVQSSSRAVVSLNDSASTLTGRVRPFEPPWPELKASRGEIWAGLGCILGGGEGVSGGGH